MTAVVNCYGQPTHAQPLARVGQTSGDGSAGMTLDGGACDVPRGRTAGDARGKRGRAVIVYNPKAVTHILRTRTISPTRTLSRSAHLRAAPHICRELPELLPEFARSTVPRSRHSRIRRTAHTTHPIARHVAFLHFFVAIVSRCDIFAHV